MLALLTDACQDKHNDGNDVREHLDDLSLSRRDIGNDERHDIARAEQKCAEDTYVRLPKDEDNEGDCKPSERLDRSGVLPATLDVVHYVIKSTYTCDSTSRDDRNVLIKNYVDTRRVCGCRALADRAQMESDASLIENDRANYCRRDREVHKNSVSEKDTAKCAQIIRERQCRGDQLTCGIEVGTVNEGHNEVGRAATENRDSKTRDILVAAKSYGQERVHAAESRRKYH